MTNEFLLPLSEILVRTALALLAGVIIGLEREISNHPAGIKTHSLVCIGSALTSMLACEMGLEVEGMARVNLDISRIAAGVVTGIGFIGAGTIIKQRNSVILGLTTAATLWVTACLGLAIGMGYYLISIAAIVAVLIVVISFRFIGNKLKAMSGVNKIEVAFTKVNEVTNFIAEYCENKHIQIMRTDYLQSKSSATEEGDKVYRRLYVLKFPKGLMLGSVLRDWNMQDGVVTAREADKFDEADV